MTINVLNIRNEQTRNLFRAIGASKDVSTQSTCVNSFRKNASAFDIAVGAKLIQNNSKLKNIISTEFPKDASHLLTKPIYDPIPTLNEYNFQKQSIIKNKIKLKQFSLHLKELNNSIATNNEKKSLELIVFIYEKYGYSLLLISKLAYLYTRVPTMDGVQEAIERLNTAKNPELPHYLFCLFSEIYDPNDEYINVLRRWDTIRGRTKNIFLQTLLEYIFAPGAYLDGFFSKNCSVLSYLSTIDVTYYILQQYKINTKIRNLVEDDANDHEVANLIKYLSNNLPDLESYKFLENSKTVPKFRDLDVYRNSIAFSEYGNIAAWRFHIDSVLANRWFNKLTSSNGFPKNASTNFFKSPILSSLLSNDVKYEAPVFNVFDIANSGVFLRTVALLHCINNGFRLEECDSIKTRKILSNTTLLFILLKRNEITNLIHYAEENNNLIVSFLGSVMLYDSRPTDEDYAHQARNRFQLALINWFKSDIIAFLDWMNVRTPDLCDAVVSFCTINNLERLYFLMEDYESVILTRAAIAEWYGKKFSNLRYIEIAERLRRDIRIFRIRRVINNSRIFIDELRFQEWCVENVLVTLGRYIIDCRQMIAKSALETAIKVGATRDPLIELRKSAGIEYHFYKLAREAFYVFCRNRHFGIESYLSRRIRHGTLHGHMLVDIRRLLSNARRRALRNDSKFDKTSDAWLEKLEKCTIELRGRYLQFRSVDSPDGWLSDDLAGSDDKVRLLVSVERNVREMAQQGRSAHDIIEAFSDFCWQALQTDLLPIRTKLLVDMKRELLASIDGIGADDIGAGPELRKVRRELGLLLDQKFVELTSWFDRPSTASISVLLRDLCEAVVAEVREQSGARWSPVIINGQVDLTIFGIIHHHIYDCLYILIGNAATYGKPGGGLTVTATVERVVDGELLVIEVTSERV